MPKAKLQRNQRITCPSPSRKKRKKEDGRPNGTFKRYLFEETRLGFFLKFEVPVVFDVIQQMTPPGPFFEPPYLLVKIVCESSPDPSLRKPKFYRYLEEYMRVGVFCKRPKRLTAERAVYYGKIRKRKLERYLRVNISNIAGII